MHASLWLSAASFAVSLVLTLAFLRAPQRARPASAAPSPAD